MALLFMESFDHFATADILEKWSTSGVSGSSQAITINASSGRRSSGAFHILNGTGTGPTSYLNKVLAPADATCIVGVALKASTSIPGVAGYPILSLREGTSQVYLRLNADYTVTALRGTHGSSPTVLGTTSVTLTAGSFVFVELKVTVHNSAGVVQLRFNGVDVLNLASQDTQATATAAWTSVSIGIHDSISSSNNTSGSGTLDYDDLYVLDGSGSAPWNTFLGDCRVDAHYATAEGASSAWTPSTGSDNALTVDETAPNDDTDYNEAATAGLTDTFVTADAVAGGTIYGVQHCLSMKKTDVGACTVAPVIRHSGTDYAGTALAPGTTYAYGLSIAAVNPGTAAAWTEAGFNAAEFGYTRTL